MTHLQHAQRYWALVETSPALLAAHEAYERALGGSPDAGAARAHLVAVRAAHPEAAEAYAGRLGDALRVRTDRSDDARLDGEVAL